MKKRLGFLIVILLFAPSLAGCIGQETPSEPNGNGTTDPDVTVPEADVIKARALSALANVSSYSFGVDVEMTMDPRPISFFIISYNMPPSTSLARMEGAIDMATGSLEAENEVSMNFFKQTSEISFDYSIANNESYDSAITQLMGLAEGLSINNQDMLGIILSFFEDSAVSFEKTALLDGEDTYVLSIDDADPKELYDTLGTQLLTNITGSVGFMGFIQNFMTAMIDKYIKTTEGTFKIWIDPETWLIRQATFDADIFSEFEDVRATNIPLIGSMEMDFEVDIGMGVVFSISDYNVPLTIAETAISDIAIHTSMFPETMENVMNSDLSADPDGWQTLLDTMTSTLDTGDYTMDLTETIVLSKPGTTENYEIRVASENGALALNETGNQSLAGRSFFQNNRFIEELTDTIADPDTGITMEMDIDGTATVKIKQAGVIDLTYYMRFGDDFQSIDKMWGGGTMYFSDGTVTNSLNTDMTFWTTAKDITIPMS